MTDLRHKLSQTLSSPAAVWTARIVLGAVFVFSGWVKAEDPWGTIFKLGDYFAAWGMNPPSEMLVIGSFGLSAFEFILGVMLITGCFRRVVGWLTLATMSVMTLLTLYIVIADPVSDCGCFGDAIKLTNGQTFAKNVVLTAIAVIPALYNRRCRTLYTARIQWLTLVATWAYIAVIQLIGYLWQPAVDFRQYKVGANLPEMVAGHDDGVRMIYEKDGVQQAFAVDSLPDDSWTYVTREQHDSHAAGLAIFEGDDDVTDEVLAQEGPQVLLTVSDPERLGMARSSMINRLARYVEARGGSMLVLAGGDYDAALRWKSAEGIVPDVYSVDDTDLKSMARGEPAVIYLDNGVIKWKRALFSLSPRFPEDRANVNALDSVNANAGTAFALKATLAWLVVMIGISFLNVVTLLTKKKKTGPTEAKGPTAVETEKQE